MTHPIAAIAPDRSVCTIDAEGKRTNHSSVDLPLMWASWDVQGTDSAPFSWPTWSPNARQIACFRLPGRGRKTAAVYLMDVDGVQATELADLGDRLPIYLFWSPDGERLALLSQSGSKLTLSVLDPSQPGREVSLATGSPLFFCWAGDRHLAAFVGSDEGPRIVRYHAGGRGPDHILPGRPGNFCAPLFVDERVIYVHHEPGQTHLVSAAHDDAEPHFIESLSGLVSMVPCGDSTRIARAIAPDGDATPYRQLGLVDVRTGEVVELSDEPCLAYLPAPDGSFVITAQVDTAANLLRFRRVDLDGTSQVIAELYPSRDLGFYLRFFEQYGQSHHLIDPSSRHLLLSGTLLGHQDASGEGKLWQIDVRNGDARNLGPGVFGVYAPSVK